MLEYRTPRSITVSDEVNIRKNDGIIRMLTTMATTPWIAERIIPWTAAASAFCFAPAPR